MHGRRISDVFSKWGVLRHHWTNSNELKPIGVFTPTLEDRAYQNGQTFLHKVFGYRGIVARPWLGYINNKNKPPSKQEQQQQQEQSSIDKGAVRFYHAFVDKEDLAHAQLRLGFPMLHETMETGDKFPRMRVLCDDFVCHDDILPYNPSEIESRINSNTNNNNNKNSNNNNSNNNNNKSSLNNIKKCLNN